MADEDQHFVYVPVGHLSSRVTESSSEFRQLERDIDEWLRDHGHRWFHRKLNWRELKGGQCAALDGHLLGASYRITNQGTVAGDGLESYDPGILMLMKLTWGGGA